MTRFLMIIGLALVLILAGCGSPKATIGTQPPPPPPPPPLVVDLSAGTWTLTAYQGQSNYGTLTLHLEKSGNCPPAAPGTTFSPTKCYQADQSWPGTFAVSERSLFAGCYPPTGIIVGQDADNNVQFQITEYDQDQNPFTFVYGYGTGTITSSTQSGGTYSTPCGSQTVSVQWAGSL